VDLLKNKNALILGVANERSIAWGITKELKKYGANIGLTYQSELFKKRVDPLLATFPVDFLQEMDVTNDLHYLNLKEVIEKKWGRVDILVHSLAYADKEDLRGRFSDISRPGFMKAMDISVYSFIALLKHLKTMMPAGSSAMAMTYHGSQKVLKGYNVMGSAKAALESAIRYLADDLGEDQIRVNAISAGPIKTLASSGIKTIQNFREIIEQRAPLHRNVTTEDVGGAAVWLASDLSKAVTGQIIYVDSGISITAM